MKHFLVAAAILLTIPAAASADVEPPIGDTVCSAGACMTLEQSDAYEEFSYRAWNMGSLIEPRGVLRRFDGSLAWGSTGCSGIYALGLAFPPGACTPAPGYAAAWEVQRFHRFRKAHPYLVGYVYRYHPLVGDVIDGKTPDALEQYPEWNSADCNPTGENERYMVLYPGLDGTGYIARADAPEGFREACKLLTSDEAAARVAQLIRAQELRDYGRPSVDRTCADVAMSGTEVDVASDGVTCAPARDVLARFLRGAGASRGFRCTKLLRAASCRRVSQVSSRTIIGRWRR